MPDTYIWQENGLSTFFINEFYPSFSRSSSFGKEMPFCFFLQYNLGDSSLYNIYKLPSSIKQNDTISLQFFSHTCIFDYIIQHNFFTNLIKFVFITSFSQRNKIWTYIKIWIWLVFSFAEKNLFIFT